MKRQSWVSTQSTQTVGRSVGRQESPPSARSLRCGFPLLEGWEEDGVLGQEPAGSWPASLLASPSPRAYKYALSKRGSAPGPGERAGKKDPTLSPR